MCLPGTMLILCWAPVMASKPILMRHAYPIVFPLQKKQDGKTKVKPGPFTDKTIANILDRIAPSLEHQRIPRQREHDLHLSSTLTSTLASTVSE